MFEGTIVIYCRHMGHLRVQHSQPQYIIKWSNFNSLPFAYCACHLNVCCKESLMMNGLHYIYAQRAINQRLNHVILLFIHNHGIDL